VAWYYLYTLDPEGQVVDIAESAPGALGMFGAGVLAGTDGTARLTLDGGDVIVAGAQGGKVTIAREGNSPWQLTPEGPTTVTRLSPVSNGAFVMTSVTTPPQTAVTKITVDGQLAWTTPLPTVRASGLF
jgi:hypothetical protein